MLFCWFALQTAIVSAAAALTDPLFIDPTGSDYLLIGPSGSDYLMTE